MTYEQAINEVAHIFDSGANEIRVIELIEKIFADHQANMREYAEWKASTMLEGYRASVVKKWQEAWDNNQVKFLPFNPAQNTGVLRFESGGEDVGDKNEEWKIRVGWEESADVNLHTADTSHARAILSDLAEKANKMKVATNFIQWKGTDICMDLHCECGHHNHYDGQFAYAVQCANCEQIYKLAERVDMVKVDTADNPLQSSEH